MANPDDRFIFIVDWYDQPAALIRKYNLTYYTGDNTIEMFDIKNRRIFLRRTQYPDLNFTDLFLNNTVTVYGRQLKIVDYADVHTRRRFENERQRTFAMIKPDAYPHIGKIIAAIQKAQLNISQIKMMRLTAEHCQKFYEEHVGRPFYNDLVAFISSDVVVGMELVGNGAIQAWRNLIGPTNTQVAQQERPDSLRALYGTDGTRNAVHGSDSVTSATREIEFFFGLPGNPALINNCTACVIKPHAMPNAGRIIDLILEEGFEISALQSLHMDKPTAQEFFEVYKGVLPEFTPIVEHMTSGPCIAMEIRQENAVQGFRELCGPHDPEVARHLRPHTLRAIFGSDRVHNAVHCTDLVEDGELECEYFFRLLLGRQ